jgi:hypothetical protein
VCVRVRAVVSYADFLQVAERYKPQRRYRRGAAKAFQDEESRVQATLLEYGYKGTTSFIVRPPPTHPPPICHLCSWLTPHTRHARH